tara:strand:+ start:87 stop:1634 length:1548 start_codon:yes stop_codon:yes gene_type:complete
MLSNFCIAHDTLAAHPEYCDYEGSLYRSAFALRQNRIISQRTGTFSSHIKGVVAIIIRCLSSLEILYECISEEDWTNLHTLHSQFEDDWADLERCLSGVLAFDALQGYTLLKEWPSVQLLALSMMHDHPWNFDSIGPSFLGLPPGCHPGNVLKDLSEDEWQVLRQTAPIELKEWASQQYHFRLLRDALNAFHNAQDMATLLDHVVSVSSTKPEFLPTLPTVPVKQTRCRKTKKLFLLCPVYGALKLWQPLAESVSSIDSASFPSSGPESEWILSWLPVTLPSASRLCSRGASECISADTCVSAICDWKQIPLIDFISVCWATALLSSKPFLSSVAQNLDRNLVSAKRTNWQFFLHLALFPYAWRGKEDPGFHIRIFPETLKRIGRKISNLLTIKNSGSASSSKSEKFLISILDAFSSSDYDLQVVLAGFHTPALLRSFSIWREMESPPPLNPYGFVHDCLLPAMEEYNLRNVLPLSRIAREIYCRQWQWSFYYPNCEERPFSHSPSCHLYQHVSE